MIALPLRVRQRILHPESAILQFGRGLSIDVGALCYRTRSKALGVSQKSQGITRGERLVDVLTLVPSRRASIRALVHNLSDLMQTKRPLTVFWRTKYLIDFMDLADKQDAILDLGERASVVTAFHNYVDYLRHRSDTHQIVVRSAAIRQFTVLNALVEWLGYDNIHHGINLLPVSKYPVQTTEPPSEDEKAKVLALCESVFNGFTDLCVNRRAYPFRLSVPKYLHYPNDKLWIFPGLPWCMTPQDLLNRETKKRGVWVVDYENGRLADASEIAHRYAAQPGKNTQLDIAQREVDRVHTAIMHANEDPKHCRRRQLAAIAHNSFLVLFLANTAMNWSSVMNLQWRDDYQESIERQGFRTIKYRASGRVVSFEIQSRLMPNFQRFLALREYLLRGSHCKYLFISIRDHFRTSGPLTEKSLNQAYVSLRRIDPTLPRVMAKKWRAGKSDWLLRRVAPEEAALILQNSVGTVVKSYAEGSSTTQQRELTRFFEGVKTAVLQKSDRIEGAMSGPIGPCTSFGHPKAVMQGPIAPNCSAAEGCLFCDKYRVHVDEKDVRKILSFRYCLEKTARMSESEEQYQVVFVPLFKRIDEFLKEIKRHDGPLVLRITKEVERGELDPYWATKLEALINLGVPV